MAKKRLTKKQKAEMQAAVDAMVEGDLPPPDRQLPAPEIEPPFEPGNFTEGVKGPWRGRMRAMKVYPEEGISTVITDDRAGVGIQADEDKRLSDAEKEQAREEGFSYSTTPRRSYLTRSTPEAFDRAESLADRIAEQRRAAKENGRAPF